MMERHANTGTRLRRGAFALLIASSAFAAAPASAQPEGGGEQEPEQPRFDERGRQQGEEEAPPTRRKITLPEPITEVQPDYPAEARAQGTEGVVVLKLTIDVDGSVVGAEVDTPGGHGFDEAALAAAPKLRFSPARYENGNPFKAIIRYRFNFELKSDEVVEPQLPEVGIYRGKVLIRDIDEPLAGATLVLRDAGGVERTLVSGADGSFDFGEIEPGTYKLSIRATGYDELALTEVVEIGDELTATYRLSVEAAAGGIADVVVGGEKPPREVTRRTIERREIERIPGTNGDALRSIQSLPGVARVPGGLGILLVRGSAPQDTLTFVDGIDVPLIYHFGGLSSVIPTELLDKIDFYPGNFSARYGRAMGGIVDAGIRSPSDEYHGLLQLDLIDARIMLEGPVPNLDGWTFAAAGRRSWLDAWLGPVLEAAGAGVTQAPRYYDYQFMVERKWDTGKLRTSFYGSDDGLELLLGEPSPGEPALTGNIGFSTAFQRLQVGFDQELDRDSSIDTQLAFRHDSITFSLSNWYFDLNITGFTGRVEYTQRLARSAQMHVGVDMEVGEGSVAARLPAAPAPGQPANQPFSTRQVVSVEQANAFYRPATYLEMELSPISRWRLVPGFRLDYAKDSERFDASPRFNTRFDIVEDFPRTTVKGGIGMYHQPPQFQEVVPPFGTAGLGSNLAIHYGLGAEQEITKQLEVSLEGFYKQMDNLVVAGATSSAALSRYDNVGLGYVVGSELLVKYKPDDHFFGWLAYTLSRSVRQNGPDEDPYLVSWDQTHILTVLGSYRFAAGWEVGARFRLVSGNLTSPTVCNPAAADCDPSRINALYHGATGAYTPIRFGAVNDERLPLFHSLDLRIDKAWQFTAWKLSAYVDVQNVYNSQNVEGISYSFDFSNRQFVTGLPFLPSIGLRGEF